MENNANVVPLIIHINILSIKTSQGYTLTSYKSLKCLYVTKKIIASLDQTLALLAYT